MVPVAQNLVVQPVLGGEVFGNTDKKVIKLICQCLGVSIFIKKLVIPLLLDILPSKRLYLPPPLTGIGGIYLGYFAMIVMLLSFAGFALDLIPSKFIVRGVFATSNKSHLTLANPDLELFRNPWPISWAFLNYSSSVGGMCQ